MADRLEDLLEAERRGLLPPDLQNDLNEARNRGLIPNASDLEASPFDNLVEGNVDVLRSAISGVGQGVQDMTIRLPQALSGMTSLAEQGVNLLRENDTDFSGNRARLFTGDAQTLEEAPWLARTLAGMADQYSNMEGSVSQWFDDVGITREPETTAGRYAESATEFGTAMLSPGGGPKVAALVTGLLTGLTAEGAGDVAEELGYDRSYGELLGALLTPLGAATLAKKFRTPATNVASDIVKGLPAAEREAALRNQQLATQRGTTLFPAEVAPQLRQLEGDAAAMGGEGAATLREAYQGRANDSAAVVQDIIPDAPAPGRASVTEQLRSRAEDAQTRVRRERTDATSPGYTAAGMQPVDLQGLLDILTDAGNEAIRVGDSTVKGAALAAISNAFKDNAGNPFTTVEQVHNRYQELRDALKVPPGMRQSVSGVDSGVSAVVTPYLKEIKELLRDDPQFKAADDLYQAMSPEVKAIFGDAATPDLASLEAVNRMAKLETWDQIRPLLVGERYSPSDLRTVLGRVNKEDAALLAVNPAHQPVMPQVASELLRQELARASKARAGAPEPNSMREMWNAFSNENTRGRLLEILRASGEAQGMTPAELDLYVNGIEEMFSLFRKMAPNPAEGSPTAGRIFRAEDMDEASTLAGTAAQTLSNVNIARPGEMLDRLFGWSRRIRMSNYGELARVLTDPEGIRILSEMGGLKRGSPLMETLIEELISLHVADQSSKDRTPPPRNPAVSGGLLSAPPTPAPSMGGLLSHGNAGGAGVGGLLSQ
jgi:hypothetical protein